MTEQQVADFETWVPTKPEYSDEEIRETPLYKKLKQNFTSKIGGKLLSLPDETVIPIAKETIKEIWDNIAAASCSDEIEKVFARLSERGINHGNEVLVRLTQNPDGTFTGTYKLTKTGGRKRFSHEGYASLIGYSEDPNSPTYAEALKKLETAGYSKDDLHDGFLLVKNQMRSSKKNGVFELVITKGDENNKLCKNFKATLYQFPDDGAATQAVVFPPASGDKKVLVVNDDIIEVGSMSKMMVASILGLPQTPAVMFSLMERLKALGLDVSKLEEDDTETETEESPDEPQAQAPAPASPKKGVAQSLLKE